MKSVKKIAAAMAAITALSMFGGCTQLEEKNDDNTAVITFGDEEIMLSELDYYIKSMEYSYEAMFGSDICKSDLGDGSTRTVGDYVIEIAITQLRQTKILDEYAQKNGIELTEEQEKKVSDAVDKVMSERADYVAAIGADEDLIKKVYTENAIANEAYLKIVEDVDTTVGDDEFLRKSIAYVKLTPNEIQETTAATEAESTETETTENETAENETAETVSEEASSEKATEEKTTEEKTTEEKTTESETMSEDEKLRKDAMDEAADEIRKLFEDGKDASDFIDDFKNSDYYSANYSTTAIGEDSTEVYTADAWKLSTDETAIYTGDDGSIYILRCLDDNDEESRDLAIKSEIESRKSALFEEKYEKIQDEASKFTADQDVIKKINFNNPVYVAPSEADTEEAESAEEVSTEVESTEVESTDK